MSPTSRVLIGLVLGAAGGLALAAWSPTNAVQVADAVQPFGRLWLNALQMTVVPLVFALVVVGVNTASDAAASGRIARRAIVAFILILTGGALFAAAVAPRLFALFPHNPSLTTALESAVATHATPVTGAVGWAEWFNGIIPANAIMAAAQSAMLPLVVFALILAVCARAGLHMLSALGIYVLVECLIYLAATLLMLPVAVLWGGETLRRFVPALVPAQIVAASTQSSLASLPAMLESAERRLGYPPQVNALVLPMAVSLFRLTSPIQYVVSACFIAWAYGIDVGLAPLFAAALLAVVISLGSVGLPGAVSFMATNLPVAQAMGVPVGPLGLMLAVDALPDALATLGNVTADLTATSVVARQSARETSKS